jgi:hypothetical protein
MVIAEAKWGPDALGYLEAVRWLPTVPSSLSEPLRRTRVAMGPDTEQRRVLAER